MFRPSKTAIDTYINNVLALLDCSRNKKKEIREQLRLSFSESPEAKERTYQELEWLEGTPETMAESLVSLHEGVTLKVSTSRKKMFVTVSITVLLLLMVVLFGLFVLDNWQYTHGTRTNPIVSDGQGVPATDVHPNVRVY